MDILYTHTQKSFSCEEHKYDRPTVEIIDLSHEEIYETTGEEIELIFILKGTLDIPSPLSDGDNFCEGKIILAPHGYSLGYTSKGISSILIFRIRFHFPLCNCLLSGHLYSRNKIGEKLSGQQTFLFIKPQLKAYLESLIFSVNEGFECVYFYESKLNEFYYYLNRYYTDKEVSVFFSPLLGENGRFHDFVLRNHYKVKTVGELVTMMNYSRSGFEKQFKKIFDVSPGSWMQNMRMKHIYNEIKCSNKPFKEISEDYGFYSPSHFNDYCKQRFGRTPGEIRKK